MVENSALAIIPEGKDKLLLERPAGIENLQIPNRDMRPYIKAEHPARQPVEPSFLEEDILVDSYMKIDVLQLDDPVESLEQVDDSDVNQEEFLDLSALDEMVIITSSHIKGAVTRASKLLKP